MDLKTKNPIKIKFFQLKRFFFSSEGTDLSGNIRSNRNTCIHDMTDEQRSLVDMSCNAFYPFSGTQERANEYVG